MTIPVLNGIFEGQVFARPIVHASGFLTDENGIIRAINRTLKDVTAIGNTELVPVQAGLKIRVLALFYRSALAVAVQFKSNPNNNISASYSLGINDDVVWPYNPHGWIETVAGESLTVSQSLAVASGAQIVWVGV